MKFDIDAKVACEDCGATTKVVMHSYRTHFTYTEPGWEFDHHYDWHYCPKCSSKRAGKPARQTSTSSNSSRSEQAKPTSQTKKNGDWSYTSTGTHDPGLSHSQEQAAIKAYSERYSQRGK